MKRNPQSAIRDPQSGWTLLEAVISMGVFAAVITLALQTYVATYKLLDVQGTRAGQLTEARTFLHMVKRDARTARATLPQFKRFIASDKTLILQLPAAGANDVIIYHPAIGGGIARTISPRGRSGDGAREEILSETLSNWRFSVSGSLVTIEVNERQVVHHREARLRLRAVVRMRNGGR